MWMKTAFQHISPEAIVKGCMKCCVSNVLDGADVEVLRNGIEEEGNVKS
jgi:uncharacterized cysteine cluster protein YcgN (CxxCxxCC family)